MGGLVAWVLILLGFVTFIVSVFFKKEVPEEDSEGAFKLIIMMVGLFMTIPLMMLIKNYVGNVLAFFISLGIMNLIIFGVFHLVGLKLKKLRKLDEEKRKIENEQRRKLYEAKQKK